MVRARPRPKNTAVNFLPHELFFSRTDPRGIILSGNTVFVRISGYSQAELLSQPHNIIRHPDMPRCAFELLWNFLKAQRPVCAYVKNLAKDGSYYWVYAAVFPVEQGYLSLRLKPTTPILPIVEGLYAELLAIEKEQGVPEASEALNAALTKLGFDDYEHFMTHALFTEIESRRGEVKTLSERQMLPESNYTRMDFTSTSYKKTTLCNESAVLERYSSELFDNLIRIVNDSTAMQDSANKILDLFSHLKHFSLNMVIAAEKVGNTSRTLVVVAETFQTLALEIKKGVENLKESLNPLKQAIRDAEFKCASSQLQTEMIRIFSNEFGDYEDTEKRLDFVTNFNHLFGLIHNYAKEVDNSLLKLVETFADFTRHSSSLHNVILGLEMIRIRGAVEAARLPDGASFAAHIESMHEFIHRMREQLDILIDKTHTSLLSARHEQDTLALIYKKLTNLKQELTTHWAN